MRGEPYVTLRQGGAVWLGRAGACGRGYPAGRRPACLAYVSNLHLQGEKSANERYMATMATMATPKPRPWKK